MVLTSRMANQECRQCHQPLDTSDKHNWCCGNEEWSASGIPKDDMYEQMDECPRCDGIAGWVDGMWECDDCGHRFS